jgi:methyltransferase family protein
MRLARGHRKDNLVDVRRLDANKLMNWKWKARIQRACASLPFLQEPVYYFLQSSFGRLRESHDPFPMLEACSELVTMLEDSGRPVSGARVMEVGTGRGLDMPLGFFLCGAESVITFDLHRYLKPSIVMASIGAICANQERAVKILAPVCDSRRLRERLESLCSAPNCNEVIRRANIQYRAPADAARTGLPDHSIDIQISYTVLEHIPPNVLRDILLEANRLLESSGFALHHIDPSDHFSHEDPSILPINFLQYSDAQWERLAGNQFAYHNRMRANEFAELYAECGHQMRLWKPHVHQASLNAVTNGFPLDSRFRKYSPEILSTVVLQVLSRPRQAT